MSELSLNLSEKTTLPVDGHAGAMAGRVWRPQFDGPSIVAARAEGLVDVTHRFPTMRDLCEQADPAASLSEAPGERFASLSEVLANTPEGTRRSGPTMASRAFRSAGDQGRRRHIRDFHAGAGDRGARARRYELGGGDPRRK